MSLLLASGARAQAPFPPPGLLDVTSAQQVLAVVGATNAEPSGYLLIDAPEAVAPGAYRVRIRSDLPGTSHLVLIRQTLEPVTGTPLPQKVVVLAERLDPGMAAVADVELIADHRQYLSLLAFSRGRWFVVSREVKIGRAVRAD